MRATQIAEDKIRAYRATDYRLGHDEQSIVLRIGQRCDLLAPLFASRSVDCGAFLTAYNPVAASKLMPRMIAPMPNWPPGSGNWGWRRSKVRAVKKVAIGRPSAAISRWG